MDLLPQHSQARAGGFDPFRGVCLIPDRPGPCQPGNPAIYRPSPHHAWGPIRADGLRIPENGPERQLGTAWLMDRRMAAAAETRTELSESPIIASSLPQFSGNAVWP